MTSLSVGLWFAPYALVQQDIKPLPPHLGVFGCEYIDHAKSFLALRRNLRESTPGFFSSFYWKAGVPRNGTPALRETAFQNHARMET